MLVESRRNGFGDITAAELKNLQNGLLNLLLEFDALCRKHAITYYLDGGSVIGALRHEGFIPWDDDIDILIKRDQFEKLLAVIDQEIDSLENRRFSYMQRKDSHHRPFARYIDTSMLHAIRNAITEANYPPGIFLDIFILDPVPASKLNQHTADLEKSEEWFHKRLNGSVGRMSYSKYRFFNFIERYIGEDRIFRYFDKQLSRYSNAEADYYVPRNGFNYAVYEADVFQEPRYVRFEGHMMPIPTMPEKYLRGHYSIDWFNLPPEHARYSAHYTLTSLQIDAKEFLRKTGYASKQKQIYKTQEKRHNYQILGKKPFTRVKAFLALLNAKADSLAVNRYLDAIGENEIKRLATNNEYDNIICSGSNLI